MVNVLDLSSKDLNDKAFLLNNAYWYFSGTETICLKLVRGTVDCYTEYVQGAARFLRYTLHDLCTSLSSWLGLQVKSGWRSLQVSS